MKKTRPDYVYLIRCADRTKIGTSAYPRNRFRQIAKWLPWPAELLRVYPGGRLAEHKLHSYFAAKRTNFEWFELTDDDLTAIDGFAVDGFETLPWPYRYPAHWTDRRNH